MKHSAVAVMWVAFAFSAKAADHEVRLVVHNAGGAELGWHFSQYYGRDDLPLPISKIAQAFGYKIPDVIDGVVKVPGAGKSHFKKFRNIDDDPAAEAQKALRGPMKGGDLFDETFTVTGPGIFIFDVSDWKNGSNIEAKIFVDDDKKPIFSTSSLAVNPDGRSNINNWHSTIRDDFKDNVRVTDDREIAFFLN